MNILEEKKIATLIDQKASKKKAFWSFLGQSRHFLIQMRLERLRLVVKLVLITKLDS